MRRDRQLRAEHVQLVEIELHHPARLQPQRAAHHVGGDEGIAVAVAADPAAHAQERGELACSRLAALLQPVFQHVDQPRHLAQEGVIVERQAVGDLVEHGELGPAQEIGLPQRQHLAAELLVAGGGLVRGQRHALAAVEQAGDLHLAVHGALAADLGRVRGQDRADQRGLEETAQHIGADPGVPGMGQRLRQHAGTGALGGTAGAHLADVVLVLGDVGEVGEIAEGADDPHRLGGRHAVEDLLELAAGEPVLVAVEPDRGLADALDQVEHIRRPPGRARCRPGCARAGGCRPAAAHLPPAPGRPQGGWRDARWRRVVRSGGTWLASLFELACAARLRRVCKFFAAAQDEVGGGAH